MAPDPAPGAAQYRRVLLVVDLTEDSRAVGARARAIAATSGAELALLHVVEYVPVEPMGETLMPAVEIEQELVQRARERLRALARELALADAPCRVEAGNTKAEIVRVATEWRADLVVIGSRERHGLSILVNLTEDTVLHAAPCDVLAVRLR
jgi:universal stress protein A